MPQPQQLLERLDAIGLSVASSPGALALIGLGSAGIETARMDSYSDLDFFAVVAPDFKECFLSDLSWLARVHPVAWAFKNTVDGYKLLFADGIFAEFAVFTLVELKQADFAPGRLVWSAPGIPMEIARPTRVPQPPEQRSVEWLAGEALTNLVVGLWRFQRGEKLSAMRFVQHYAVDRVIELTAQMETEQPCILRDPYNPERRIEMRYPGLAEHLADFIPGYEHTPSAALNVLLFLERHVEVNPAIRKIILDLIGGKDYSPGTIQ